ncbi:hypothetical protein G6O69_16730 [Pseudenhygromyxa sp. WMMC2535]|uniref:hypothetical protein n=1 Tax=Pseudenhygromyxa sp. WMMC2535 TaxID=2712867 RepID=UPI0015580EFB|nr:hypothetical protein [Pseudenhygromyxa sp. WMMC2535]NVB39490.1 hypothetical protein [Pseudenhygromyxa sp. WMMC2535]
MTTTIESDRPVLRRPGDRNSWERRRGDEGYPYLPYAFVKPAARDMWTIPKSEWFDERPLA